MPRIAEQTRLARREQIAAAALACFGKTGYHATTMADVAAQAGVSKGTPYLYFPSKEALFISLLEEWDCGVATRVDRAVSDLGQAGQGSPRSVLRAVAAALAAHAAENPLACRVLMEGWTLAATEPAIAATVLADQDRSIGQLGGLIAAGVAAGQWPPDTDPALAARLFTAGLYGLMAQWHLAPGSFSLPDAAIALAEADGSTRNGERVS
jgi:TetR/AcrR family transcriptional regulator, transcriptional repressor of aconitase